MFRKTRLDAISPGRISFRTVKAHNTFKNQALHRIRIAEGHLKKVEEMLANDEYCPDVIHQSRAVQAALKKFDEVVLHGHLHSCVMRDIHGTESEKEKVVAEIVEIFSKKE